MTAPSRSPLRRWGSFPTTADVGLWARGRTPEALLEALGLGLYALMTDLRRVRPTTERAVSASAQDPASLVVAFLSELLVLRESEGFVGRRMHVRPLGSPPTALLARVNGERFDPTRHVTHFDVKAVTFHGLLFDPERGRARVIVDI